MHTLVNSGLTKEKQDRLDQMRQSLLLTRELVAIRVKVGDEPSPETVAEMDVLIAGIKNLEKEIAERDAAALLVDQQKDAAAAPVDEA